jgi:hypothetical protein
MKKDPLMAAFINKDFVSATGKHEEEESEPCWRHLIHAVFVAREPPKALFADLCVRALDAVVHFGVAVLNTVPMRSLVVLPVETVDKNELPYPLPE